MIKLLNEDCTYALTGLQKESIDSMITDPPAGISFAGLEFDSNKGGKREWVEWLGSILGKCRHVLKPHAYCFVWALPRTSHWTIEALEYANFEIIDVVTHLFGSGFPTYQRLKPASEFWILARKGRARLNSKSYKKREGRLPSNVVIDDFVKGKLGECGNYFYCAKPSKSEKNAGLDGMEERNVKSKLSHRNGQSDMRLDGRKTSKQANFHATVKPIKLMRHLIRLITPPKGMILDPFMGSGTTGVAVVRAGFSFTGIEKDKEYFQIAEKRIGHVTPKTFNFGPIAEKLSHLNESQSVVIE